MPKLTDVAVRKLKSQPKAYQKADGEGLLLEVRPSGQKAWLYRYRLYGRQEKLSLGTYPDVSVAEARDKHADARKLLRAGKSPAHAKQAEKQRLSDDLQVVRGLAKAYIEDHLTGLASAKRAEGYVRKHILPSIGGKLIQEVQPVDCVAIVQAVRRRGAPAVARKVLEQLRGLFDYAVAHHLLTINPAAQVKAAKVVGVKRPRDRTMTATELRQYLTEVDGFQTSQSNRIAFKLILLTMCRKGELVKARKDEVNLERGEWVIPAANVKTRQEHVVYLSRQAKTLFGKLIELAGSSPWLLPGRDINRHMSLATLNQVLYVARRRDKKAASPEDIWIHDMRRTASTILHEMGWPSDVIEKALGHAVTGIRGVYNRAQYATQRAEMLQAWADFIDGIVDGADVVPIRKTG